MGVRDTIATHIRRCFCDGVVDEARVAQSKKACMDAAQALVGDAHMPEKRLIVLEYRGIKFEYKACGLGDGVGSLRKPTA